MEILVGVLVIVLVALVVVLAEGSPPSSPLNNGPVVGTVITTQPVRGLNFGGQTNGCLMMLAIAGLVAVIVVFLWIGGIL
jgi:hypothetical protein